MYYIFNEDTLPMFRFASSAAVEISGHPDVDPDRKYVFGPRRTGDGPPVRSGRWFLASNDVKWCFGGTFFAEAEGFRGIPNLPQQ